MIALRHFGGLVAAVLLAGCTTLPPTPAPDRLEPGWAVAAAATRQVGLGLPGGAALASGVEFSGGLELVASADSPLHSLSDLKLIDGSTFLSVSDNGLLVRGRLHLDRAGRLSQVGELTVRPLADDSGQPLVERSQRDAEGLAVLESGELLVAFERNHRIWSYGPANQPGQRPTPVAQPDYAFPNNDGMEALAAAAGGGWRVAGESGGVWDCRTQGCTLAVPPPDSPLRDSDYRITGLDRDPLGSGWFVIQRSFSPPLDARARVRRMSADGSLGPVLIELKLPGTTDNFEGIAAVSHGEGTRLYLLSDDNNEALQRTLLLAFDVR